jgi:hypothetical protein
MGPNITVTAGAVRNKHPTSRPIVIKIEKMWNKENDKNTTIFLYDVTKYHV